MPIGIGFKMRTNNFGFEFTWGIRKTSSDYLDDVSGDFIDTSIDNNSTSQSNTTRYENVSNIKRGDKYTKDWYVSVSYTHLTLPTKA